jgi:hypothetical protein
VAVTIDVMLARMGVDATQLDAELPKQTAKFQTMFDAIGKSAAVLANGLKNMAAVGAAGMTAIVAGLNKGLQAAAESEAVWSQLDGALQRTGQAAGVTRGFVDELATKMQRLTTQGDETTASMVNLLLKFQSIKGEATFERIVVAAKDFAAATGGDAVQSAEMLGRALENPATGMRALRLQAGLAAEELAKVKELSEAGDTKGSQEALLQAFEQRFAGAAVKEAATFAGAKEQLSGIIGDVWEEIGFVVLPRATELAKRLTDIVWGVKDWVAANREFLQQKLDVALEHVTGIVTRLYEAFKAVSSGQGGMKDWLLVVGSFTALGTGLAKLGSMIPVVGGFVTAIGSAVNPLTIIKGLVAFLWPIVTAIGSVLAGLSAPVLAIVAAVAALGAGITLFLTKTEKGREVWAAIVKAMGDSWDWLVVKTREVFAWFGTLFAEHTEQLLRIKDKVVETVSAWGNAFMDAWENTASARGKIADWFAKLEPLLSFFVKDFERQLTLMINLVEMFLDLLTGKTERFKAMFLPIVASIMEAIGKAIGDDVLGIGKALRTAADGLLLSAKEAQDKLAADEEARAAERERKRREAWDREYAETEEQNRLKARQAADAEAERAAAEQEAAAQREAERRASFEGLMESPLPGEALPPDGLEFEAPMQSDADIAAVEQQARDEELRGKLRGLYQAKPGELRRGLSKQKAGMRERFNAVRGQASMDQRRQIVGLQDDVTQAGLGVIDARQGYVDALKTQGPERDEAIQGALAAMAAAVEFFEQTNAAFNGALANVEEEGTELFKGLGDGADEFGDAVKGVGDKLEGVGEQLDEFGNVVKATAEELAKTPEEIAAEKNAAKQANAQVTDKFSQQFNSSLQSLVSGAASGITGATVAGANLANALQGADRKTVVQTMLAKIGAELKQTLINKEFAERGLAFGGGATPLSERMANVASLGRAVANLQELIVRFRQEYADIIGGAPQLAAGGIVTRRTFAMIGERGPEAVIPLSRGGLGVTNNVSIQATFTDAVTPERADAFLDAIDRAAKRRGVDMSGRSVLRRPQRTAVNSRVR